MKRNKTTVNSRHKVDQ